MQRMSNTSRLDKLVVSRSLQRCFGEARGLFYFVEVRELLHLSKATFAKTSFLQLITSLTHEATLC